MENFCKVHKKGRLGDPSFSSSFGFHDIWEDLFNYKNQMYLHLLATNPGTFLSPVNHSPNKLSLVSPALHLRPVWITYIPPRLLGLLPLEYWYVYGFSDYLPTVYLT